MCLKVPALESPGVWPDMLKYLTKFALDVLPSVVATILGAYIVNHYVNTKSDADARSAAVVSPADTKNQKNDSKSLETAKIPEPGVKAKGISERAMIEKSASEGLAEVKPVEKPAEVKPAETASIPAETRRTPAPREKGHRQDRSHRLLSPPWRLHQPTLRRRLKPRRRRKNGGMPMIWRAQRSSDCVEAAANVQEASRPETNRPEASRAEANRNPEPARSQEAVRTVGVSPVRPLPPPIAVATRAAEGNNAGSSSANPPYTASIRNDDPNRPTPPAEIPSQPPLDLRAAANEAATPRGTAPRQSPKTCCRPPSRCSTRCCRSNERAFATLEAPLPAMNANLRAGITQAEPVQTYRSSGRACRRRGQSRFARLRPGPQIDGAAVGAGGLGLLAQALVGQSPRHPGLCVLRIDLDGLVEIGGRFLCLVEREIAQRGAPAAARPAAAPIRSPR